MMTFMNGQERTLGHTVALLREAGWCVERVYQVDGRGESASQIQAVPI